MTDIPSRLPTSWFAGVDRAEIERLIEHARTEAAETFFDRLGKRGVPSPADIKIASDALGIKLLERVESIGWIETLCGEDTPPDRQEYLKIHLKELLVPPEIPDPTLVRMEVRTPILCVIAAIGAVLGFLFGGWLARVVLQIPVESGLMFGAPIGAALGVLGVMFLANNETLRNRILLGLGIAGGIDVALQIFKGFIPWPTGGKVSFLKRLVLYAVLAVAVFLSRREKVCDREHYRKEVESIVDEWLHSALAVIAVLTFKVQSLETSPFIPHAEDTETLTEIVSIAKKLKQAPSEDVSIVIDELAQELATHGFEIETESPTGMSSVEQTLIWDDSLSEQYKPFGILHAGDSVRVVKEPVIRDGVIEEKGVVKKTK